MRGGLVKTAFLVWDERGPGLVHTLLRVDIPSASLILTGCLLSVCSGLWFSLDALLSVCSGLWFSLDALLSACSLDATVSVFWALVLQTVKL